jgi:hypothetical protein
MTQLTVLPSTVAQKETLVTDKEHGQERQTQNFCHHLKTTQQQHKNLQSTKFHIQ